jgi:cysteinyl-tRNA synthetase
MALILHNTIKRTKETFEPIDPKNVRVYVCGPTVYDYAHIGNGRPSIVFDILVRLLRHIYGDAHVTFARNITDIDDKILTRAEKEGRSIKTVSDQFTDIYNIDMASLNVLPPDIEPRATDHLPEMISMMKALIEKGNAYVADGHVLFNVPSMKSYGGLSRHSQEELEAGARVEVAPYKKSPTDFVLWKPSLGDQPGWESAWGKGRPGWHLECSAMIKKHLGETIDIHGGGMDLIFPHHENEIAQSESSHGKKFVNYWLHNGYVTMSGEKMSKSLGNVKTIRELSKLYKGEALRMSILNGHYRQPLDFSGYAVDEQKTRLDKWYRVTKGVVASKIPEEVLEALMDDLNTPKALSLLGAYAVSDPAKLKAGAEFMGFLQESYESWFQSGVEEDGLSSDEIEVQIQKRIDAKSKRDFGLSDQIRCNLKSQGIILEDGEVGTTWRREP